MERHSLDPYPMPKDKTPLYINEPWLIDINDAMGIFQQVYPNTVRIDYDNSHTREIEQVDISRIAENKSFPELIGDFYRLMYGCGITEEEMDVMRTAAREAGVINEAD